MNFEEFKKIYERVPVDLFPNAVTENPLVSVCVQTYQHSNYIKDCLEGTLMQQTDFPFEILLGEDQSTDGTREICMEYARKYPDKIRLFLHHRNNNIKINGRASGKFNFLYNLFEAKGKYIAICEGDDYWTDPFKLQKQLNVIHETNECKLIGHRTREVSEINSDDNFKFIKDKIGKLYFEDVLKAVYPLHISSVFFEKSSLLPIPSWITKTFSGDKPVILLLALNSPIFIIDQFMSVYRHNSSGFTKQKEKPHPDFINSSILILYNGLNDRSERKYNYLLKREAFICYLKRIKYYFKKRKLTIKFVIQGSYDLIRFMFE